MQLERNNINPIETKKVKPEKLYRGFVVDPATLSESIFKNTIKATETTGEDGNEPGVYMTDNLIMVESTNYSARTIGSIKVPMHDSGYGRKDTVSLPGCGVILEINAQDLPIREPKIHPVWQGHYNNGFKGKEWILDSIPPEKYKVKELILSEGANDPRKFVVKLNEGTEEELKSAIEQIKIMFEKRKVEIEAFKNFLLSIPESSRMVHFLMKKKWEEYKKNSNIE